MVYSDETHSGGRNTDGTHPVPDATELQGAIHDINQMLGVILGRAELHARSAESDRLRRDLATIALAAGDAARVLARLGPSSVAEAAGDTSAATPLAVLVEQACRLIQPPAPGGWYRLPGGATALDGATGSRADTDAPGWRLELDVAPDLATDVPDQVLREVLCNLLSNALNVLPEGGTVAIAAERRERIVHLVVRDTGPGLDERLADDLFAAGATTGRGLGRGYGLHVSRRILTDHGGDLTHVRPADGGAAFRLEMPATDPAPAAMADTDALTSDLDPGTVVVVDDDAAMREMLNDVLQALGQQVTVLPDAASALAACAVGTWQVAFVDVKLPDRSGRDLAAQLRRRDPALAVVLVSGWGTDIDDAAADPAVDLTARKPLSLATITQLLENGQRLNRRRREEDARTQWPEDDGAPE